MEAKALTFQPIRVRKRARGGAGEERQGTDDRTSGSGDRQAITRQARRRRTREGRAGQAAQQRDVRLPAPAASTRTSRAKITDKYPEVGLERQDIREYPGGSLGREIVGVDRLGRSRTARTRVLAGLAPSPAPTGRRPTTAAPTAPSSPAAGATTSPRSTARSVELTIDSDLQYYVQQQVPAGEGPVGGEERLRGGARRAHRRGAGDDATTTPSTRRTGVGNNRKAELGNLPVTTPFEPGSVNKIVTAAAAIEYGAHQPRRGARRCRARSRWPGVTVQRRLGARAGRSPRPASSPSRRTWAR